MQFEREVRRFLGPRGPLARILANYEERPEQSEMAAAVLRALDNESLLVVEAGTGTGKTLAYLAPALYSKRRVVISTGTKALQEQLVNKDLPALASEFEVKVALMKGRANYLCWRRFQEFGRAPEFRFREEIPIFERITEWARRTESGDRSEIPGLPDDYPSWREISSNSEQCRGQKCDHFRECFITRMRAAAQQADIVVVNHHLFFADLAIRAGAPGGALPAYGTVIFDEAHSLPEVATEYFGAQASNWRVMDLVQDVRRLHRLGRLPLDQLRALLKILDRVELSAGSMFKAVLERGRELANAEGGRFPLAPVLRDGRVIEEGERAAGDLRLLSAELKRLGRDEDQLLDLSKRADLVGGDLAFLIAGSDPDHVFWAEPRGKGVILRASPIELGPILGPTLFEPRIPMIFTSATLAVMNGKRWEFSHFRQSLGLMDPPRKLEELWLASSYNWRNNAMLYVPRELVDPSHPGFIAQAADEIEKILRISKGRAFILFTSYRNLERAYDLLCDRLEFPVLKQGDAPKSELLDEFREDENSVLFATHSFWEGVDVAGQSLTSVIIDKLPFDSPGDPLIAARIDRIRKLRGDPFNSFQLPRAVLALKQGLGRLIRSKNDYGILAVLDCRLHARRYGATFLSSLPPAPLTHSLEDLERFMQRHEK